MEQQVRTRGRHASGTIQVPATGSTEIPLRRSTYVEAQPEAVQALSPKEYSVSGSRKLQPGEVIRPGDVIVPAVERRWLSRATAGVSRVAELRGDRSIVTETGWMVSAKKLSRPGRYEIFRIS